LEVSFVTEEEREEVALFWYGLLVPALNDDLAARERTKLLEEVAAGSHRIPNSKQSTVTVQTLRRKLRAYREKGFAGLKPTPRADRGKSRALPAAVIEKAVQLRVELPSRSTRKLAEMLAADPEVPLARIPVSTLSRALRQRGCTTRELKKGETGAYRKFVRDHLNELWQSDLMHGPYLPDPADPRRKKATHLVAFLDDCSRLVPHAQFYWDEKLPRLEDCLKKALMKRGVPQALYVDNAQIYHARQLQLMCAEIGLELKFCQPYSPQAKGKIERFFAFAQTDFLPEAKAQGLTLLDELNDYFWCWLEMAYHRKVHTNLGTTPLKRWLQEEERLRFLSPLRLREIFLWREERTVDNYGSFSLQGNRYQADPSLVGKKILVRYDPFDLSEVYLYRPDADDGGGQLLMKAPAASLNRHHHKNVRPAKPEPTPPPSLSTSYLDLLKREYDEHQREDLHGIHYTDLEEYSLDPQALSFEQLTDWASHLLGEPLSGLHEQALKATHEQYGPFRKEDLPTRLDDELDDPTASLIQRLFALNHALKQAKLGGL